MAQAPKHRGPGFDGKTGSHVLQLRVHVWLLKIPHGAAKEIDFLKQENAGPFDGLGRKKKLLDYFSGFSARQSWFASNVTRAKTGSKAARVYLDQRNSSAAFSITMPFSRTHTEAASMKASGSFSREPR